MIQDFLDEYFKSIEMNPEFFGTTSLLTSLLQIGLYLLILWTRGDKTPYLEEEDPLFDSALDALEHTHPDAWSWNYDDSQATLKSKKLAATLTGSGRSKHLYMTYDGNSLNEHLPKKKMKKLRAAFLALQQKRQTVLVSRGEVAKAERKRKIEAGLAQKSVSPVQDRFVEAAQRILQAQKTQPGQLANQQKKPPTTPEELFGYPVHEVPTGSWNV